MRESILLLYSAQRSNEEKFFAALVEIQFYNVIIAKSEWRIEHEKK
jgi:hypothetical protein